MIICHSIFRNVVIDPQFQTSTKFYFPKKIKVFKQGRNYTFKA